MVRLEVWQKKRWLQEHRKRLRHEERYPNKTYRMLDPFYTSISRYTCDLCGDRFYYYSSRLDKDAPQYHSHKKRSLTICHACWHLKGFYLKHQEERSLQGLSGCRFCNLQLAAKRARKRYLRSQEGHTVPD